MDREYYQSLSEAYQQVQEQGGPNDPRRSQQIKNRNKNQPEWVKNAGNAINNFLFPKGRGERKPTVQQQQREKMRQNRRGRSIPNPNPPASTPAAQPSSQPAASSAPAAAPRAAAATPAPQPTAAPAQRPATSGTSSSGQPIRTSDVQRRNAATADRAAKVRASGGDPTAGGEFKTKVTDTGSARLNKALSGIGKWNEETVLEFCGKLIEARLADNVDDAYVILTHLDEAWVEEALGE